MLLDEANEILREASQSRREYPRILSRILHVFFRERMQPLDPHFVSEDACYRLLVENRFLRPLIEEAVSAKDCGGLWNCELLKFQHVDLASFHSRFDDDLTAQKVVQEVLGKCTKSVSDFANGRSRLSTWVPPPSFGALDASTQSFLSSLDIPRASDSNPCLVLHDLGSMIDHQPLQDRIRSVFTASSHTMFINASGSGKTRLLFEGLCEQWGVYMSCAMDASGVGSRNLAWNILYGIEADEVFKTDPPWEMHQLCTNEGVAQRIFHSCFLAGLIFLKTFLESIDPEERDTLAARQRWLLLQTCPFGTNCGDVALTLSDCIQRASPTYIKHAIADTLLHIRALLRRRDAPIFCVVDECQVPDTKFAMKFRDEVTPLRLLARSYESFECVTVILTGKSINREPFCRPDSPQYRVCTDTGAFDTAERQQTYILRYLPPVLAASSTGRLLISRMWTWLKGRYQFTASFISCLLMTWFEQPQMLLTTYVFVMLKIEANDISDDKLEGPLPYSSQRAAQNFQGFTGARLEYDPQAWYSAQSIMLRLLLGEDSVHITENCFHLARHGVTHFTDACGKESRAYEPTVLCPLARRIFKDSGVADGLYPMERAKSIKEPPIHRTDHLAFASVLVHALREKRLLCDLFSFPGIAPAWAAQNAQLVRVVRQKGGKPQAIKVDSSFAKATAFERWVSYSPRWLQQKSGEPFCVASQFSEADLLFVLQLEDGRCVYVALACVFRNAHVDVSLADVGQKLESLAPCNIFRQASNTTYKNRLRFWALPEKATYMGDTPVLRVVSAFPYEVDVNEVERDAHPQPIATVNMSLVREVAGSIAVDDVVRRTTDVLTRSRGKKRRHSSGADVRDTKRPRTRAMTKVEWELKN